jgi:hypothetical protein
LQTVADKRYSPISQKICLPAFMPNIFLCHTTFDKAFVEKLANDLKKVGVNVWFDKWEVKVGESILWRIEEGIRSHEYLGVVLSPEALQSEWVRTELGAAWSKQMSERKVGVLPILYRECNIPLFLCDRKYADFRGDYQSGFIELVEVLGLKHAEALTKDNWRRFTKIPNSGWQKYREEEFKDVVTALVDKSIEYNWSVWVGASATPFSITLFAIDRERRSRSISLKLCGKRYAYMATFKEAHNPNNLKAKDFDIYVGNTLNEVEEFVWRKMEDFRGEYGDPEGEAWRTVSRFLSNERQNEVTKQFIQELSWYRGERSIL